MLTECSLEMSVKFSDFKLVTESMDYPRYQCILLCCLCLYPIGRGGYDKNIDKIQGLW